MIDPTRRSVLISLSCMAVGLSPAHAAPTRYSLVAKDSNVGFRFFLSGAPIKGSMPVQAAQITIDPSNLGASQVDVTLNVAKARTSLFFATDALISAEVLDAKQFPTIRFVSQSITLAGDGRLSGGASVHGLLTLRGMTRPITLNANVLRAPGSAADDLSNLTVRLDGSVSRSAFGATGFPDLVTDIVELDILAVIAASS
ncbi:YceI family protein [Sedimentitalea todarodis]|uniref:YceI family protein n=1 Tax=Sedimentitalea todarodis TaxID=1631240 RepID=A0ABU3V9B2_9RHOB|nr:YceI family protein [Sedimentitalea todarodis]MDU9002750.1 YceI family protein [Sedimentitalea todarodis]